jgi:hypothetical protein
MPRPILSVRERRCRALGRKANITHLELRSTVTPIGAAAVGLGLGSITVTRFARSIGPAPIGVVAPRPGRDLRNGKRGLRAATA